MARHDLTPDNSATSRRWRHANFRGRACFRGRGIASIEFVIILPVLLLLLMGVLEYGWMLTKSGELINAARDGARVGARIDATSADITTAVNQRMADAEMTGYTLTITPAAGTGDVVTVEITQPYAGNVELLNFPLLPIPANLRAEVSMRKEGP